MCVFLKLIFLFYFELFVSSVLALHAYKLHKWHIYFIFVSQCLLWYIFALIGYMDRLFVSVYQNA